MLRYRWSIVKEQEMIRWNKVYRAAGLLMLMVALSGCSGAKATVEEVMEEIQRLSGAS